MGSVNDKDTVREQYKTADKLHTRISIHEKYSTNKQGWGSWLFSQYDIFPKARILELGCGTGDIWKSNLQRLDKSVTLCLTDFSENMVSAVKETFGEQDFISYGVVNIEDIPYVADSYDIVIANMMLYHVPDLQKGLSEVWRVLSEDGCFYCATYGENGIMPFIAGLLREYGVTDTTNKNFTLQNGCEILKEHFTEVRRLDYADSLVVTDVDDMLDYIESLANMSQAAAVGRSTLKRVLENEMRDGVLHVPKEYGMFICRK